MTIVEPSTSTPIRQSPTTYFPIIIESEDTVLINFRNPVECGYYLYNNGIIDNKFTVGGTDLIFSNSRIICQDIQQVFILTEVLEYIVNHIY